MIISQILHVRKSYSFNYNTLDIINLVSKVFWQQYFDSSYSSQAIEKL